MPSQWIFTCVHKTDSNISDWKAIWVDIHHVYTTAGETWQCPVVPGSKPLSECASRWHAWNVGEMWQVLVIFDGNSTSDGSTFFKDIHCVHKRMIKEPWLLVVALVILSASCQHYIWMECWEDMAETDLMATPFQWAFVQCIQYCRWGVAVTVALHNTVGLWFVLFVIEHFTLFHSDCSLCMHKVPEFKSSATLYDRVLSTVQSLKP